MAVNEFNRVVQSTLQEYVLGQEDNIVRNRKLLALMKAKGRITFNHSGTALNWAFRYKRRDIAGYADGDTLAFSRSDLTKRAELPWRGYTMTDMVTKKEKLMNRGKPALIRYISEMAETMMDDFGDRFHSQLYVDGNAAGNSKKLHGFDSFTSFSGAGTSLVGLPNDTYGGQPTTPGALGGSWSGTWPSGEGDAEYDAWSPILVDYTDADWSATTKTWPNTCHEALRFGILKGKRNDAKKGMIDTVFLDGELFRQWETTLDEKERVMVKDGGGGPTLRSMGWGDVQNFEGAEITWEYGVPADANGVGQGYGFNVDEMELCSLQDRLFVSDGPYYDEASLSDRYAIHMFGNLKFNPRYFVKWVKIT
jgi:hypothetical protein